MFEKLLDLFLNAWVWGATWGFFHIPINIILMLILLKFVGKFKIVPAVLLALFSEIFAVAIYTFFVFNFIFFDSGFKFAPQEVEGSINTINVLLACITGGLVGSFFQSIFFVVINRFYSLNLRVTILLSFFSNIIAALLMYKFLDIN